MATKIVTFKVTGISALLMNNPASMEGDGGLKARTKDYSDEKEAEKRLYRNAEGKLYVPSIALLRSLWYGSSYQKIGKDSARARIQAGVFIIDNEAVLLDKDTEKPIDNYDIDKRSVVVQRQRITRCRPTIKNWICYIDFEIETDFINEELILPLFKGAGKMIGVLDYRPQKTGPFGRYSVEIYKK